MRLPVGIGDRNNIGVVVDHDGVVNVVVDDVARRRFNIDRWPHPYRDGRIIRDRKNIGIDRGWRRWKIDKIDRPERQEENRCGWGRSEPEFRIVEYQYPALDVDHFLWWRWRHIISDHCKPWRWFKCRRQICQPAPRIV